MSEQLGEALKRAVLGAIVTAGATFFGAMQTGKQWEEAAVAAGAAAFTYILVRGGFEGQFDANRAERGDVIPSDVR